MFFDLTHRAMISLAAKSGETRAAVTAKGTRALRLSRIQIRRSQRSLRKLAQRARVSALMRLFRAQQAAARLGGRAFTHANRWSATIVALLIVMLFVVIVQDPKELKTSEVHLTCAQVIGAALALILSLSIIPAQRAAEAFSPAVLKLYAQDRWLFGAFVILALTTTGSVLLGTNFFLRMDPRISIGIQFLLLGVSFDALRIFHGRALDLLIPQTAIQLVICECTKLLNKVSRLVEKLTRLQALAIGKREPTDASRAIYFSASQVSGSLRFWIAQLDEIAHKLIARRDTSAANDVVTAMGRIGTQYSEARRNSLILLPDFDNLFAGGGGQRYKRRSEPDLRKRPRHLPGCGQIVQRACGEALHTDRCRHDNARDDDDSFIKWRMEESATRFQPLLLPRTMCDNCGQGEYGRCSLGGRGWIPSDPVEPKEGYRYGHSRSPIARITSDARWCKLHQAGCSLGLSRRQSHVAGRSSRH